MKYFIYNSFFTIFFISLMIINVSCQRRDTTSPNRAIKGQWYNQSKEARIYFNTTNDDNMKGSYILFKDNYGVIAKGKYELKDQNENNRVINIRLYSNDTNSLIPTIYGEAKFDLNYRTLYTKNRRGETSIYKYVNSSILHDNHE